jgi:signal transduction histidine kinase
VEGDSHADNPWHGAFLGRAAEAMRGLDRSRPYALDLLLAALVAALGAFDLLVVNEHIFRTPVTAPAGWIALSLAGQALPLAWRRRRPATVFAVVLGFSILQWSLGVAPRSAAGLLFALYAVGRYGTVLAFQWAFLASIGGLSIAAFTDLPFRQTPWTSEFLLGCTAVAAAALAVVARYRRAKVAELADRAERLEVEREQREQLAALAERARVAREMHDIVGHNLAVIIGLADGAAFAADTADTSHSAEALHLIADTGRQALNDLRRTLELVHDAAPGSGGQPAALSPQPGIAQLPALLDRVRDAGLRVTYRVDGDPAGAPAGVQLAAYRIVQEALTNTLRHAAPGATVEVEVVVAEQEISISVCNDAGLGQPGATEGEGEGRGLRGIVERAALMGGVAAVGATDEGGWAVRAILPLHASPAHLVTANGMTARPKESP